jgi:cell wall-associated NlpC family hydrolase
MRPTRLLLLLLAVLVTVALALLRPLPGRAAGAVARIAPKPAGPEDPRVGGPADPRAHRRLSSSHRVSRSLLFGERVVRYAKHLLGVPYRYGGSSPAGGFDCSGFVRYVYSRFGVSLPHSSFGDLGLGRRISRGALHAGDLVFFDGAGHVGIYVGGGLFIHAPHTGTVVRISTMADGWYGTNYVGARRLR